MKRIPESDVQRQQASDQLRFGLPNPAVPAIAAFIQTEFAPADDAWRAANQRLQQALGAETLASDKLEATQAATAAAVRQLANRMLDPLGRVDHDARLEAFGAPLTEVLKGNPGVLVAALSRALGRFAAQPHPEADATTVAELQQHLATLEADRHAAAVAQATTKQARSQVQQQRETWDNAYRRVVQCVNFHTTGNDWRAYLLTFRERKDTEIGL